jgi:type II secretion system protein N
MKERLIKLWNERLSKYGGIVGYPVFYLVCLGAFASLTFPYDKLKERIVLSFNADQRASAGTQELQIDDISGYWLSGVRLKGVSLFTASTEPGKPRSKISIDDATVRFAMLPMLVGGRDLNFDAQIFGGDVRACRSKESWAASLIW